MTTEQFLQKNSKPNRLQSNKIQQGEVKKMRLFRLRQRSGHRMGSDTRVSGMPGGGGETVQCGAGGHRFVSRRTREGGVGVRANECRRRVLFTQSSLRSADQEPN